MVVIDETGGAKSNAHAGALAKPSVTPYLIDTREDNPRLEATELDRPFFSAVELPEPYIIKTRIN